MRIALATAREARGLDDDMAPLVAALEDLGCTVEQVDWDATDAHWASFDAVVLRSTWDYAARSDEFLAWIDRVEAQTRLLNPASVVRWNIDKHYLAELAQVGVATVPSSYIEPGEATEPAIRRFLDAFPDAADFVVKPCVGAGSRDARRHPRGAIAAATAHADGLLDARRSLLLQPYLDAVDSAGETALVFIDGTYSHAIRKGPLLQRGADSTDALFAPERIDAREPSADERELAAHVVSKIPQQSQILYARIDLLRDGQGAPRLLELELVEPSLFFAHGGGSARRMAVGIVERARAGQATG